MHRHQEPSPTSPYDRAVLAIEQAVSDGRMDPASAKHLLIEVPTSIYGKSLFMGSSRAPSFDELQAVLSRIPQT